MMTGRNFAEMEGPESRCPGLDSQLQTYIAYLSIIGLTYIKYRCAVKLNPLLKKPPPPVNSYPPKSIFSFLMTVLTSVVCRVMYQGHLSYTDFYGGTDTCSWDGTTLLWIIWLHLDSDSFGGLPELMIPTSTWRHHVLLKESCRPMFSIFP